MFKTIDTRLCAPQKTREAHKSAKDRASSVLWLSDGRLFNSLGQGSPSGCR